MGAEATSLWRPVDRDAPCRSELKLRSRYGRSEMATRLPGPALLGRRSECDALQKLLAAARDGHSGALVLRGEPGVGKTALLDYTIESASEFRVARTVGVESEMELPFAAVQQLCASLLERLEQLPDRQQEALRVAFGLSSGQAPDRFLVGLAVLSLLSEAAQERPVLPPTRAQIGSRVASHPSREERQRSGRCREAQPETASPLRQSASPNRLSCSAALCDFPVADPCARAANCTLQPCPRLSLVLEK